MKIQDDEIEDSPPLPAGLLRRLEQTYMGPSGPIVFVDTGADTSVKATPKHIRVLSGKATAQTIRDLCKDINNNLTNKDHTL